MQQTKEEKRFRRSPSRRKSTRICADLPVEVYVHDKERQAAWCSISGMLLDVSPSGVAVEVREPISQSADVRVRLNPSNSAESIEFDAKVAWSRPSNSGGEVHCGLSFGTLMPKQTEVLTEYINSLLRSESRKPKLERRELGYYETYVHSLESLDLFHQPREIDSSAAPIVKIGGKEMVSLCSNNVMGSAVNPEVIEASCAATRQYGTSCGSSRLVGGNLSIQVKLEHRIATFMRRDAGIVYMTGYMANLGLILSMSSAVNLETSYETSERVAIFCDRQNHTSIIQGCKLSENVNGARVRYYLHRDMNDLERLLQKSSAARKIIVSEGVFSMIGDIAPLKDIVTLARKYHALTIVDDAHAIGILGESGRGSTEALKEDGIDIILGTFSKAFGAVGGFVVTRQELIEYFKLQSPTYIFSSALPPGVAGGILKAIDILDTTPAIRERLWKNVNYFKERVVQAGFTLLDSQSHITPIFIGEDAISKRVSQKLFHRGTFIQEVRWPAVASKRSILRCMPSAIHTTQQLDKVIDDLIAVGKEEKLIPS